MFGCVGNDSFGVELINYLKANDVQADNVRVQEGTCLKTGEILEVPARKAKVADTTGAGDTLNGALAVRITKGDDIGKALRYANVAASLSTEKIGAQGGMPRYEALEKELKGLM